MRLAPVENIPGAAGTIGLARFIGAERGRGDVLLVSGLIMLGGIVTHQSPVTLRDVVPIARLTGEYEVIAVPAASPLRSLQDLLERVQGTAGIDLVGRRVGRRQRSDPRRSGRRRRWRRSEARELHRVFGRWRVAVGHPRRQVSVGINGFAEFAPQLEAGTLRALAISSAERLPGVDVPTLARAGRGRRVRELALAGRSAWHHSPQTARASKLVARAMVQSATWRESLARYRWLDRYLDWRCVRALRRRGRGARARDPEEARDRRDEASSFDSIRAYPAWCSSAWGSSDSPQ